MRRATVLHLFALGALLLPLLPQASGSAPAKTQKPPANTLEPNSTPTLTEEFAFTPSGPSEATEPPGLLVSASWSASPGFSATPSPTGTPPLGPLLDLDEGRESALALAMRAESQIGSPFVTLHDQVDYPQQGPGAAISSQNFEPARDASDDQAADDFQVPGDVPAWAVTTIEVDGYYTGGGSRSATSINIWFYKDSDGLPGEEVYAALEVEAVDGLDTGSFIINLSSPAALAPGHYWVSVQANLDWLPDNRQWPWRKRTVQHASESAWRNPGNAFGTGCIDWGKRVSTCGSSGGPDLIFRLSGASAPVPTTSVYVHSKDVNTLYSLGRLFGEEATDGIVILSFRAPRANCEGGLTPFGSTLGLRRGFCNATVDEIAEAVKAFVVGWWDGYWARIGEEFVGGYLLDPNASVTVAIGTSNCGNAPGPDPCNPGGNNMPPGHGEAWAEMVDEVREYVDKEGYSWRIETAGAIDVQLPWNHPSVTIGWIDGYSTYFERTGRPSAPLYNFGSCDGCTNAMYANGDIDYDHIFPFGVTQWQFDEVWDVAWGKRLVWPIPEIYTQNGSTAENWTVLARYSSEWQHERMYFPGLITQSQSCTNKCPSEGNKPAEGWLQLFEKLYSDPGTRQFFIPWLTDIDELWDILPTPTICTDC